MSELLRVFERYEIVRQLTSGGMGDIFLARQVGVAGFERLVVLKSLRPELVEDDAQLAQFLNEARVVAQLNHPNIVAVLEVDEYRGVYFIAMEYIAGVDLGALLRGAHHARQRVPFRVSAGVVLDAARGLAHAHQATDREGRPQPLVHRDVSPQNVMIRVDGIAKVLDFGIATVAGHLPEGGRVQGKLRYMSPEQLLGRALSPASDQFALGVVLWELCAQRRLFTEADPHAILRRMLAGPLPGPRSAQPDVPPELDALVSRMIALDPAHRYPTSADVVDALRTFVEHSGGPAERAIERFVGALGGAELAARTRDLVPTPVSIPGLLPATEVTCAACQQTNQRRHRYCTRCGAPLTGDEALPASPGPPKRPSLEPIAATRTVARPSIHTLLFEQASALRARRDAPPTATAALVVSLVLGGRDRVVLERGEAVARHLDRQVLERVAAQAEAFDARTLLLRPTEAVLALPSEGEASSGVAARRALRFAAELGAELERHAASQGLTLTVALVLTRRELDLTAPPAARRQAAELALAPARGLTSRATEVFVDHELTTELHDAARFGQALGTLRRVEKLLGDTPARGRPVLGRRPELAAVRAALAQASTGVPHALLLVGEPGMGKSRLLAEATSAAAKRGFVLVALTSGPASAGEQLLGALGEPPLPHEEIRLGRVRAIAERRPLWLSLDDADHAPPELLASLAALRADAGPRLLVCLTSTRRLDLPWTEVLALAPLGDDRILGAAQSFADELPLPPAIVQPLLEHARGNPGRAEAVVRAVIAGDGMRRDGPRWVATPGLAQLDLGLATQALDLATLSAAGDDGRRVLSALALHGEPLPLTVALACAGPGHEAPADRHAPRPAHDASTLELRLLELRAWVRGAEGVTLEPGLARCALLALEQDGDARGAAHEALGRALGALRVPPERAVELQLRVASHLLAGEARQDAIALALTLAAERSADARTLPLVRRALHALAIRLQTLELPTPDLVATTATHGRAALTTLARADHHEAVELVATLRGLAQPASMQHVWLLASAELALPEGRLDDARRALAAAGPLAHDARARAETAACWAEVHEAAGELSEAIDRATESLEHAAGAEVPPDFTWRQSNMLGRLHLRTGDLARAEHLFELALEAATDAGSARGRVLATINLATVTARAGRLPAAEAQLERAAAEAEAAGEGAALARALHNRGRVLAELGRTADARAALERCVEMARDSGWAEGEALSRQALDQLARRRPQ